MTEKEVNEFDALLAWPISQMEEQAQEPNQQNDSDDCLRLPLGRKASAISKKTDISSPNKINTGHWTSEEHDTYLRFLEEHQQGKQKNNKIFKLMSLTIGTRSPSQCRSHHQKFNPSSPIGQKRRGRKRINSETPIIKQLDFNQHLQTDPMEFEFPPQTNFQDLSLQPIDDFVDNLFRQSVYNQNHNYDFEFNQQTFDDAKL